MNAANPREAQRLALLVATSGDTGSAALFGFARQRTPVVVLYPALGVSSVQRLQMTATCPGALVIGVEADFDWCQTFVKQLLAGQGALGLADRWLLSSANSINFGRLAPQVAYSVQAYAQLLALGRRQPGEKFDITFPTGNFGNIFGALFARRIGLPIAKIVCASNDNNVLFDFFRTGVYDLTNRPFLTTASPSIDILISSNLERWLFLLYLESGSMPDATAAVAALMAALKETQRFEVSAPVLAAMRAQIECSWCSQQQCLETIGRVFREERAVIDPHTAVAYHAAEQFAEPGRPMVVVSTAHWAKFPAAVIEAVSQAQPVPTRLAEHNARPLGEQLGTLQHLLGDSYVLPPSLAALLDTAQPIHKTVLPPDAELLTKHIRLYLAEFS